MSQITLFGMPETLNRSRNPMVRRHGVEPHRSCLECGFFDRLWVEGSEEWNEPKGICSISQWARVTVINEVHPAFSVVIDRPRKCQPDWHACRLFQPQERGDEQGTGKVG
tara:strand:- start:56 stop:385 length:330 start_codon:yes stop_codon:yes gene_type:complete